ncbi:MAG: nuclear transport factor 2 family protein [Burkholderiales bacterium]
MACYLRRAYGLLAAFIFTLSFATSALAAGSVAMQVEHLVRQAMEEYNTAMEANDSASFLKYFAPNASYETPLFRYSGRAELARHFGAEFGTFKARFQMNKMFVQGNSAAIVLTWSAVDRKSADATKIDMVCLYEVGSSGQFSSATCYFDSAKARALASLVK